jgi:hypothetical protein
MEFGIGCCCGCDSKWNPRSEYCSYCTLRFNNVAITYENNPFYDLIDGVPIGLPIDGWIQGPMPMAGGSTEFGPASGSGLGYYGLNTDSIRFHYYCDWSEQKIEANIPFEGIDTAHDLSFSAIKPFVFEATSISAGCQWNENKQFTDFETLYYGETVEQFVNKTVTVTFNNKLFTPSNFIFNRTKRFNIYYANAATGARMTQAQANAIWPDYDFDHRKPWRPFDCQYNDSVGYTEVPIKSLTKDHFRVMGQYASGYQPKPPAPQDKSAFESGPIVDPLLINGQAGSTHAQVLNRLKFNSTNTYQSSGYVERQRAVFENHYIIGSFTFGSPSSGVWYVSTQSVFSWNAQQIGQYNSAAPVRTSYVVSNTATSPYATSGTIGVPVALNLINNTPINSPFTALGVTWMFDFSEFKTTSDDNGCFVRLDEAHSNTTQRDGNMYGPTYEPRSYQWCYFLLSEGTEWNTGSGLGPLFVPSNIGWVDAIRGHGHFPLMPYTDGVYASGNVAHGKYKFPCFLGTETYDLAFTAGHYTQNSSSTYGYKGYYTYTDWNKTTENFLFYNLSKYTATTSEEERSDLKGSGNPVSIDLNANTVNTPVLSAVTNKWSNIGGYSVGVTSSLSTKKKASLVTTASSTTAEVVRSCACKSVWVWSDPLYGSGPRDWSLQKSYCSAGTIANKPNSTATALGTVRDGTCVPAT